MSKKKKEKEENQPVKKMPSTEPEKPSTEEKSEPENPFDFGGLPQRDLKKNLGCG